MKMPWNKSEKPQPTSSPAATHEAPRAQHATDAKPPVHKLLYTWAESPEQRHHIENLLSRDHWTFLPTCQTGESLVNLIRTSKPAAIIFQYQEGMQNVMESIQILETEYPECPRLVVCSEGGQDAFRSWKGMPPTVLKENATSAENEERLARAIILNQWLTQPGIRSVLPRLRTIPTLPAAHQRVVDALRDPNFTADEVARLMSQDIALTTNLFKTVNSAAFGLSQPIHAIPDAITMLGVDRLQALVMSAWAFRFIDENTCPGFNPQKEWDHAMAVAAATREFGRELGAPPKMVEEAFTAGMLHDLGKLLLAANTSEAYAMILADAREGDKPLWQVEKEDIGFSHAEIGACMLGIWGLSLPIVEAVAWHHQPSLASDQQLSPLTLVHLADCSVRGTQPDPAQSRLAQVP